MVAPFGRRPLQHFSIDKLVQFGDHFLVDHPVIDAQHKAVFELGVRIHEDWRDSGHIDVLRPAVEKLSNVAASDMRYYRALNPSATQPIHS